MLKAPQNLFATAYDGSVRSDWQTVEGADGYILQFYNADEPEKCIKTRYAQNNSKLILGFRNGRKYVVRVKAFSYRDGKEVYGELSQSAEFTPMCHHLKAQNVITMNKGETSQIVWECRNKVPAVTFECDDSNVATVTKGGQVTAVSDGTAEIKLTADDGQTFTVKIVVGRDMSRYPATARIMLCGDIMCSLEHQRKAALRSLDFTDAFGTLKDTVSSADYSVAVLETTCFDGAPFEYEKIRTDSGSPNCNSPSTFIDAVKNCGFNALVTANNHNCDTGLEGLNATVQRIRNSGMAKIGTLDDETHIADINGIKVGFVAVNSISNGLEKNIPPEIIGKYEPEHFRQLVETLKNEGAEYIIAYQHWGVMNSVTVRNSQIKTAEYMAQCGVDLIIGSHPHVMQRVGKIHTSAGREVTCFYSLGNLLSSMKLGKEGVIRKYPKFLLQGSAVLRNIFRDSGFSYDDTALILSPLSLVSKKSNLSGKAGSQRNKIDINKNFKSFLDGSDSDYIVIDLYTAAAVSCYKYGDSFYTASGSFISSDFYNSNKDRLEKISPPFDEKTVKSALKEYAKIVLSKYDKDKIILVRLKFSSICVKENQLRNGKSRNALNKRLRQYENYLISLLQPVVIDVSGNYFMASKSDNMMSFEPLFYDDVRIKLNSAVKRIRKDTYFSAPEIRLQLMRVIKYYDNMTARAYQPELLDRNYVSDRMAELTSKQFVAENFEYFVYLRENEIRTYDDAKILLSAKAGAERLISAIKAAECIDGDICDCSYDDIRIVFDENFLIKKQLSRKLSEVYKYTVPDNCEHIFLIRNDRKLLEDYEAQHKPVLIDIWGSCISRESVNRNSSGIYVNKYIFKQPFLLADEPEIPFDNDLSADKFCDSKWRRRTVKEAFLHEGKRILSDSNAKWLIIDMYDLICNMRKCGDSLFEVDDFILRTAFYKSISDKCESTYLFNERSREYLERALENFCKFVIERYGKNIILIKADLKDRYISLDNTLEMLSDSDNTFKTKKAFINGFEEEFARLTDCCVIDISKRFYADDRFALGGAHIVHYEDEFYSQCCKHITAFLGGADSRYTDKVDEEYIALRDMKIK